MFLRLFLFFILLHTSSVFSNPFSQFFDCVDRADIDKARELLVKITPKIEPLPFFRTVTRGLVTAMEWHFRQEIAEEKAYNRALQEIELASLSRAEKQELIAIIGYLSVESESLLKKAKGIFSKKKKESVPPFRIEAVEIYFGALLTQVSWVPASDFGNKLIAAGMRKLKEAV